MSSYINIPSSIYQINIPKGRYLYPFFLFLPDADQTAMAYLDCVVFNYNTTSLQNPIKNLICHPE